MPRSIPCRRASRQILEPPRHQADAGALRGGTARRRREGSTRQKGQVMTHEWILSTAMGRARCPRPRLCAIRCYVQTCESSASRGGGGGRRDGPSWSRARQRDLPKARGSRTGGWALARPKGAPQELGCLPDLTAQNNNEKTGQRIHDFELSIDYSSRELGLSRTRIASTARSKKREHEWMRCRRNFSHLSEGIVDEERRIKANRSVYTRQSPTRAGRGERPRDKSSP